MSAEIALACVEIEATHLSIPALRRQKPLDATFLPVPAPHPPKERRKKRVNEVTQTHLSVPIFPTSPAKNDQSPGVGGVFDSRVSVDSGGREA